MNGHHRFLVPTDLSEFGSAALRYAAMLRGPLDATLTVLFADEPAIAFGMPDLPMPAMVRTPEETQRLKEAVREHVALQVPPPMPEIRIVSGFPTPSILKTAEDIDATMIVMGTHGRRGWRRVMLGSVAENVLRLSSRPVLTAGPSMVSGPPRMSNILCPVNFTRVALDALREANAIASAMNANLSVLYVVEPGAPPLSQELEREFSAWIEPQLRGRCRYRQIISGGQAADEVLNVAGTVSADLLVIGAQHKRFRDTTIIGSTSERIVRSARCAVLTVVRTEVATPVEDTLEELITVP